MDQRCSEVDWKAFKGVQGRAHDRYCRRVIEDIARILADPSKDDWDRLEEVAKLAPNRKRYLERDLSHFSRSKVGLQLAALQQNGLLEPEDIALFSSDIQATLRDLANLAGDGNRR